MKDTPHISNIELFKQECCAANQDYQKMLVEAEQAFLNLSKQFFSDSMFVDPTPNKVKTSEVGRYILSSVSASENLTETLELKSAISAGLKSARRLVITEDELGIANYLAAFLKEHHCMAEVVTIIPSDADGIIFLGGLRPVEDIESAIQVNYEAFNAAKIIAQRLAKEGGIFITVQDTGGDFGLSGKAGVRAWLGGLPGLIKTIRHECPQAAVKAIDVSLNLSNDKKVKSEEVAQALFRELINGGSECEVGIKIENKERVTLALQKQESRSGNLSVNRQSVIVVSGGARGVTSTCLLALAKKAQPQFVLLGRTELAEEDSSTAFIEDKMQLQQALVAQARARGENPVPKQIHAMLGSLLARREVRQVIRDLTAAGSSVAYFNVDIQDQQALTSILQLIRQQFGSITGIVHGAGVLADKLLVEKTPEQFGKVFSTKVKGLQSLLAATEEDSVNFIALFSSVAARYGNIGQCDYAMANEVLNKVANAMAYERRGKCLVKALNWGPWDRGMVTDELKKLFAQRGIELLPSDLGATMFVEELSSDLNTPTEIIIGGLLSNFHH